jgi:hypothetical protein
MTWALMVTQAGEGADLQHDERNGADKTGDCVRNGLSARSQLKGGFVFDGDELLRCLSLTNASVPSFGDGSWSEPASGYRE